MLAHLAKEHPHVLEMPPPQVLLEEFGQNARIFTLNYWLEIRLDIDPSQVASELRFAIELKFAEAGLQGSSRCLKTRGLPRSLPLSSTLYFSSNQVNRSIHLEIHIHRLESTAWSPSCDRKANICGL